MATDIFRDLKRALGHCNLSIKDGLILIEDNQPARQANAEAWLKSNYSEIRESICSLFGQPVYIFADHKAGRYGSRLYSGLALSFFESQSGEEYYTIYNASTSYAKGDSKGTKFKNNKQFRLGRRHKLLKHLVRWGIPKPRKQAEWWRQMGKLRGRMFIANLDIKGRREMLEKDSLDTLNIPSDVLKSIILETDKPAPKERLNIAITVTCEGLDSATVNTLNTSKNRGYNETKPRVDGTTVTSYKLPREYGHTDKNTIDPWLKDYESSPSLKPKKGGDW
ncbi:MAG: hypothetical protein HWE20_02875 [Gammaproteobacteria bacterium]|nr:hypothetical protein [Gammaproteobacteria bacterium]